MSSPRITRHRISEPELTQDTDYSPYVLSEVANRSLAAIENDYTIRSAGRILVGMTVTYPRHASHERIKRKNCAKDPLGAVQSSKTWSALALVRVARWQALC